MEPFVQQKETHIEIDMWQRAVPGLVAGFSTRHGGVSNKPYNHLNMSFHIGDDDKNVRINRHILSKEIRMPTSKWIGCQQVHKAHIEKVLASTIGNETQRFQANIPEADALHTNERGLLLTMVYADCVPLFFLSKKDKWVGLAHAGWRGTTLRIGPKMIEKWQKESVNIKNIEVVIGPSIHHFKYEVKKDVIEAINRILKEEMSRPYIQLTETTYLLDLQKANELLLIDAGLKKDQIYTSSICTATDERMYSFRAEKGVTGRMIGFIGLR